MLSQQLANPPHNRFPIGAQVFEPADIHRLNAALGWLGLDSPDDARLELDGIAANQQSHPAVLEARWLLCAREKNWCEALVVARRELAEAPKLASGWLHQAYALRRIDGGGLSQAWDALLPAAEKFPKEAIIAFNLSCYACQMNRLEDARTWFHRAVETGGKEMIKKMALADEDLKPLWHEIEKL